MLQLDHIAVAGGSLDEATDYVEMALDVSMQPGGAHDVFNTHNTLMGLNEGLYLEAISINPFVPPPERPRWFDLDRFSGPPRLINWICRCDDLDQALEQLPEGFGAPVDLQRGDLKWRMAVPQTGILPFDNCAPALIEWQSGVHPAKRLMRSGVGLRKLHVCHPNARELETLLAPHFHDEKVVFSTGSAGLSAEFETREGLRKTINGSV